MKNAKLKIGWAQTGITPEVPLLMEGQMYMRASEWIHDPITATALVLDNGEDQAILVSLDITEPPVFVLPSLLEKLSEAGIPAEKVSLNSIHSHNASAFYCDFMREDNKKVYREEILPPFEAPEGMLTGEEAREYLAEQLRGLIVRAWEEREEGGVSFAHEYAAIGFNRRPQFLMEDGHLESVMYGDASEPNFIRFEGCIDTSVELMYTWNRQQEITGVVCSVPCPSQVYELHRFISADFWAPARSQIRRKLRKNVFVLPFCSAAGDMAPVDLVEISKYNKEALLGWGGQTKEVFRNFDMTELCQSIGSRITEAVSRGYETAKNYIDCTPVLRHKVMKLELPIRQVSEEDYKEAEAQVREINEKYSAENPMTMADLVKAFEPQGVVLRYRQQKETPNFECVSHIIRIGTLAVATNPFELFVEYGQRIKARARARQVMLCQLANGLGGYLPTHAAVDGGSYSSKPASTMVGPESGDVLVEETLKVIAELWDD